MDSSGTIEIDGFKLKYRIEGNGPDTLVIGSSIYYPRSFSQELRDSLRLIFIDWRGFAEPPAFDTPTPAFDTLLDDIEHIRQALGVKKCMIIGHSAHGLLALEYAKKYSRHVSHVVMIGISPNLGPEHAAMAQRNWDESVWPERKAALAERIRQFPDVELAELPVAERFVKWNVRRAPQSWFDYNFDSSSLWQGISPNMPLLDFFYGVALRDLDITKGLETLDVPVFLALGRFDYIIAPSGCWNSLRPKFKDLTVKVFERSGHSPQYEEAPLFNNELLAWLQEAKNQPNLLN
jgi:proline iminopeptidase